MRYLSICSGIEAASVAWKPLGWTAAGFSEIEPFPRAVLQARFGAEPVDWDHRHTPQSNVLPLFGDFTKIEEHHVGPIDLLVGGTPCQSFSVAGKRLGLDDPRGHLTLEYLALAKRLRPRWLVWENVPGVLSDDDGRTLGTFLWLLGQLGYRWAYRVLDAQYCRVDGFDRAVPQRRRRVFVVGHLGDDARAAAVLFDRESLRGNPAPRREAGKGVAPTIAARTRGGGGLGTDFDCDGGLIETFVRDVSPALKARDYKGVSSDGDGDGDGAPLVTHAIQVGALRENPDSGPDGVGVQEGLAYTLEARSEVQAVAHTLRGEGFDASEDGTGRGTPIVPVPIGCDTYNGRITGDFAATLGRQSGDGVSSGPSVMVPVAFAENSRAELRLCGGDGQVSSQLTTGGGKPGQGQPCIAFSSKDYGNDAQDELSPTLRSMNHDGSHANGGGQVAIAQPFSIMPMNSGKDYKARPTDVAQPVMAGGPVGGNQGGDFVAEQWAVRRLTPRECERLQGFPDDWTKIAWRKKANDDCPDGPRYKAIGNSMAVNVMRFIGERIAEVDQIA